MKSKNVDDLEIRKGQHISLCLDSGSQGVSAFSDYTLPYVALPEIDMNDVSTSTSILGHKLNQPLIIASMTGGSEHGRTINTNLALATEHCGIAMGLGSQRIGLEKDDARSTFELVRKNAPNAFLIANMGAVQLNYGHAVDSYRRAVDMIQANALYLHVNPLQEALQPGGDTNFAGLLNKIQKIIDGVGVPVIIKEVGHGISGQVAKKLFEIGAAGVDVAGVGGTSYAWVEATRAKNIDYQDWFKEFGIKTPDAVIQCANSRTKNDQIVIASGGVRSPLDGLKSRVLGADFYSAAVPFLHPAMNSVEELIAVIENWQKGLQIAMFASGVSSWDQAKNLNLS